MKRKPISKFLASVCLLILAGMACAPGLPEPTATPVPPTKTPVPTNTPKPTNTPAPTAIPEVLKVSADYYQHPSGIFGFNPPEGWEMEESEVDVFFGEPANKGKVYINATNTGYELNQDGFMQFVNATETNLYSRSFEGYNQISNEYDPASNTIQVYKTLTFDNAPWIVDTVYYQVGQAVVAVHFWMTAEEHIDSYFRLLDNMSIDDSAATAHIPYIFTYTHFDANSFFQFDVPTGWTYTHTEDSGCYVDRFESPDYLAAIEGVVCNTGEQMNHTAATQFALALLNSAYTSGAGDIKVTKDESQPDGSEKLTWTSKKGGYSGASFFESRGDYLIMLTMYSNDTALPVFQPTFDNALATYRIP